MRSDVIYIYIITCPRCQVRYVGQTDRHLITCFKEHRDRSALPVVMHFADCGLMMKEEDMVILALTNKSVTHLYILEALFVRELKPKLVNNSIFFK